MIFNFFRQKKISVPPLLKNFYKVFEKNGFEAYLVGGAIRDILLKKKPSDWDVATNATPQDVMKMFKFVVPTGFEHGTVTVHFNKAEIEVTTFRTETGYSDARHPDKINYAATIQEDLARRDFTMNAVAVNLKNGKIADPYDGRKDIKNKSIKTVGNARERFTEDGLRPIRALRFASALGFKIEKKTFEEIFAQEVLQKVKSVSIERFRDEFEKILASEKPSVGLKLMEETGILNLFIPEFAKCRGCVQSDIRGFHKFDVLDHLFYACDGAVRNKPNVRLAALFHDIGKPDAKKIVKEKVSIAGSTGENQTETVETITFYNHEKIGREITEKIMTRLKFSNETTKNVCRLVNEHMFHYEENWTNAAVRRFIIRIGPENLEDLYDLRFADMYGMQNQKIEIKYAKNIAALSELKDRISEELKKQNALSLKNLKVNGKDLMRLEIPAGKKLGLILNQLLECVIEDPSLNDKEKLLELAKNIDKQTVL